MLKFEQNNYYQTESFKVLLDHTLSEMTGEHYLARPRGLIKLSEDCVNNYKMYLINFHGSAEREYESVDKFFFEIKKLANSKINNGEDSDGELQMFKMIMSSCKDAINKEYLNNHLEKIRLEKDVDDENDYSPGL